MDLADSYDSWAAFYDEAIAGQSRNDPLTDASQEQVWFATK